MGLPTLVLGVTSLLAMAKSSPVLSQHQKRSTKDIGQVYAYGTGVSGVPVFVNNSVAYIGNLSETNTSGTYVSFVQDDDTHLVTTPISSDSSVAGTNSYLAINTTAGAQDSVVLTDASDSAGLTTTGFHAYGSQLAWISSAGTLETSWYIMTTDTDKVWALKWKATGNAADVVGAKVVVLKNTHS